MKTITGQWTNAAGGTVRLELSKYALIAGTSDNAPRFYQIPLDVDGNIPANYQIWANDELMPEGTSYRRMVFDTNGNIVLSPEQVWICGTAPISLLLAAPSPGPPPPPPPTTIAITPGSASLQPGQTQQFTANMSVVWSSSDGQISTAGLYTAPSVTSATTVTIIATSVTDPTNSTSISISVQPVAQISVTIAPTGGTVVAGQTLQFSAVASNTLNQNFTWTTDFGTISSTGLYTAPSGVISPNQAHIQVTSVADPTKSATAMITVQPPTSTGQIDVLTWASLSQRANQHLAGDPHAPYSVQVMHDDPLYPASYPANTYFQIKNKLGNPWDIRKYDNNYIYHWITENGDSVDTAACEAANGSTCWLYARAYKRFVTPLRGWPRYLTAGTPVTIDSPGPNTTNRTVNCEASLTGTITLGDVRTVTSGPTKYTWGGNIDHGAGTGASGPTLDSVNGVDTIVNLYYYSGTIANNDFKDREEYYFVQGFGEVAWYYYHRTSATAPWVWQNQTVNSTLASGGAPVPNFPCGAGKSWWV